ncbi:MAG: adenylosuccinate lyase [Thermoanaerobaculia bacterium]|nr:MAG: adenylosuccinate lyase [Thermoanaerobaculia bacterium]MBZ0102777.1 adenylosuccinate lyase [Thermoanaerobaculia bacterium]
MREAPGNPLHDRYASAEMAAIFSTRHRYATWRRLWIALAETQRELGLPIREEQLAALREAAPKLDLGRVAEIERQTRHDVVAHLRHFAEQAGEAGGILHLGATSAFITDNTDLLLAREALALVEGRLAAALGGLAAFARRWRDLPCLAYTHFQPAQLTTVGKRACLWAQDFVLDLAEVRRRLADLPARGAKGTTGTQASFLTLFDGDHDKVRELDRRVAARLGFAVTLPVSGQTYSRKLDSQLLATLAGVAESCHKMGTDLRLMQGVGELAEPFDSGQVGSSAMAYKRNPVRAERMCGLARRVMTDAVNGPLNAATQWLERSLDDSANRRLVLPDAFLAVDACLSLAGHIAGGLRVNEPAVAARVARELPFMATETLLMQATLRGGDRQHLHEKIRTYSFAAQEAVAGGAENPLVATITGDPEFRLSAAEVAAWIDPVAFTGRSARQVDEFLDEVVTPALAGVAATAVEEPRI